MDPIPEETDQTARAIVHAIFKVHSELGAGLLEHVYETCLAHELTERGIQVARQVSLPVIYDGVKMELGVRLDLLVRDRVIVEVKSVEALAHIHTALMLTYLKLAHLRLGILVNFNVRLIRDGIKRVVL